MRFPYSVSRSLTAPHGAIGGSCLPTIVVWSVLVSGGGWLFSVMLSIPVVEWSLTRDTCVQVDPATAGTCKDLPDRYHRVWVR